MPSRALEPGERALWTKVIETVRPLDRGRRGAALETAPELPKRPAPAILRPAAIAAKPPIAPANTLDASWDRRLDKGVVTPDRIVDLHGHSLARAYDRLDRALDEAIASGARVLLLITGHAPSGEAPIRRGAIRAAVGDWLAASRHARSIAAVRPAHPRHGGRGALYIVLRRTRV
ncbi:MAG: Smr/MutS family protein [Sphingomonadaceae bacterium]|nr:Smr/MutS family protein [Sphingomonadaceae bacterium]